jgi:hypothetical protein
LAAKVAWATDLCAGLRALGRDGDWRYDAFTHMGARQCRLAFRYLRRIERTTNQALAA